MTMWDLPSGVLTLPAFPSLPCTEFHILAEIISLSLSVSKGSGGATVPLADPLLPPTVLLSGSSWTGGSIFIRRSTKDNSKHKLGHE